MPFHDTVLHLVILFKNFIRDTHEILGIGCSGGVCLVIASHGGLRGFGDNIASSDVGFSDFGIQEMVDDIFHLVILSVPHRRR